MPMDTPDLHDTPTAAEAGAATFAGRAIAVAATASVTSDASRAIEPIRFNIQSLLIWNACCLDAFQTQWLAANIHVRSPRDEVGRAAGRDAALRRGARLRRVRTGNSPIRRPCRPAHERR